MLIIFPAAALSWEINPSGPARSQEQRSTGRPHREGVGKALDLIEPPANLGWPEEESLTIRHICLTAEGRSTGPAWSRDYQDQDVRGK